MGRAVSEATRMTEQDGKTTMVMWFPHEVWEAEIQQNTKIDEGKRRAFTHIIEHYVVVGVCR